MRNVLTRKRLATAAATLLMLSPALNREKAAAQENRSEFKTNFATNLVAKAETNLNVNSYNLSLIEIDTAGEAQEVADIATDSIVANMLRNYKTLAPMRPTKAMSKTYRSAVKEIAGRDAPVGLHCMRLAFENTMSGINSLGIEEEIVSNDAKNACKAFWADWKARFPRNKYADNLWYENATVYRNYEDYTAAMNKFIADKNPKDDEASEKLYQQFTRTNVFIDDIENSILLTPRSKTKFHATYYAGKMAKDSLNNYSRSFDGQPTRISFNREYIDNLFGTAKTAKISFIANIHAGIQAKVQEASDEKIKNMKRDELVEYLSDGMTGQPYTELTNWLKTMSDRALVNLALARYFGKDFEKNLPMQRIISPQRQLLNLQNVNSM